MKRLMFTDLFVDIPNISPFFLLELMIPLLGRLSSFDVMLESLFVVDPPRY